jgi:hypothetical protein
MWGLRIRLNFPSPGKSVFTKNLEFGVDNDYMLTMRTAKLFLTRASGPNFLHMESLLRVTSVGFIRILQCNFQ